MLDLTAWQNAGSDGQQRHLALVGVLNRYGGQGASDWVAGLAGIETDALVRAARDPQLTAHPAAVALELLQGERRHSGLYGLILAQALAEKALVVAAMLMVDAQAHGQPFTEDWSARFWALATDPAIPGEHCWQAITLITNAGLLLPATVIECLSLRPAAELPADLWLVLFSRLFGFQPDRAAPIDQAMRAATLAFAAGQVDQAIAMMVDLLRSGSDYSGITVMLVHLCIVAGDRGKAVTAIRQIAEEQPNNLCCLLSLADEYQHSGELVLSADYLWAALNAIENDQSGRDFSATLNVLRINCAHRRSTQHRCAEHLEQAVRCYRDALAHGETDLALWHNLGLALAELGRDEEAFEALKQAKDVVLINFWPKMTPWPDLPRPAAG